jgi:hypothetical protein
MEIFIFSYIKNNCSLTALKILLSVVYYNIIGHANTIKKYLPKEEVNKNVKLKVQNHNLKLKAAIIIFNYQFTIPNEFSIF